jgi:exosortase A
MSAVLTPTVTASPWRTALPALVGVLAALLLLYRETAAGMVAIWSRSDTFAHAFLVPPIVLWLVWRQREALARLVPRPQPLVLVVLAGFAFMWLLADLVLVNAATQFALVAMLVLAVPAVLGLQVAHAILFPLLFLFFAVPIGEFLTQPMMDWTADFTVAALRASGIPVHREGLDFVIPSGNWSVVEACSGVRYLIASFMVGTLFAYLNFNSWKRRAAFMAVSIAVPIVANWLRAYGIVMLGHHSGNTIAVGADHLVYGWVFFGVVVTIMFLIGARWSEPEMPAQAPTAAEAAAAARPFVAGAVLAGAMATAVVALVPHAALWGLERLERDAAAPRLVMPDALGTWQRTALPAPFEPQFELPAAKSQVAYSRGDATVSVYVAYYRGQAQGSKLVSSVNALVRSQDMAWNQVSQGSAGVNVAGQALTMRTATLLGRAGGAEQRQQLHVWRTYWIDGRWVAGDIQAKVVGAFARLRGRGDDGAVLVMWTDAPTREAGQALLQGFAKDNLRAIGIQLATVRDQR